jgi:hypothetical protein
MLSLVIWSHAITFSVHYFLLIGALLLHSLSIHQAKIKSSIGGMQSFPLARTYADCCREESHCSTRFSRTPSKEVQSPRKRIHQNPASRPRCSTACASAQHSGAPARWLARRAINNRARTPIGSAPTQSATWVSAQPQLSAPMRKTRTSASTCSIAADSRQRRLRIHCSSSDAVLLCCQWILQVARTSEAQTRGRLHRSHRASFFHVPYVFESQNDSY